MGSMRSEEKRSRQELVRAQRLTSDRDERPVPHVPDLTMDQGDDDDNRNTSLTCNKTLRL